MTILPKPSVDRASLDLGMDRKHAVYVEDTHCDRLFATLTGVPFVGADWNAEASYESVGLTRYSNIGELSGLIFTEQGTVA